MPEVRYVGVKAWPLALTALLATLPGVVRAATYDLDTISHEYDDSVITHASALQYDHGWPAGTIQEQLDRDVTMVPFGKGAIFVPAMTNPLDEPPVSVWQDDVKVAEGTTGRRIIVLPGRYRVEMGRGAVDQRFSVFTTVREMNVSVIPVTWSGLAVHMVDESFGSIRGTYEIIRVDTREYIDVGFGAEEQAGEPVATWIMRPGLYKIIRVGETYRSRRDFATVRLLPGKLTDFLLVVDEVTGDFKGAGEVPRDELFLAGQDTFNWNLIIGGDVNMSSRQNVFGAADGESFAFRAFVDTKITAFIFDNPLILRLQVEEGAIVAGNIFGSADAANFPWQKTQDRVALDLLYTYKLFPWLGPYLRVNAQTNLFETLQYYEEPTQAWIYDEDGTFRRARQVRNNVRLLPSVGLTSIKEGAGINLRVFKALFGESWLRVGIGGRHQITRGLIQQADTQSDPDNEPDPSTTGDADIVRFRLVPSTHQVGMEATFLSTLRITRWVLVNVEVDTLVPFDDVSRVVIDIEAALAIKIASWMSINYVFRYLRDPTLSVDDEIPNRTENYLIVRFSLELP